MANYKIADTTLTAIGDAIRGKVGETRVETITETFNVDKKISKTPNATGFDTWEGTYGNEGLIDVVTIPTASSLRVKMAYQTVNKVNTCVKIKEGIHDNISSGTRYGGTTLQTVELTFPNTDTITFDFFNSAEGNYLGYYAEIVGLDKDGNVLEGTVEVNREVEVPNTMTPPQMAQAINDIVPGPTDEELVVSGNCGYRFANGGWDWFLNKYGDRIKTKDITVGNNMFSSSPNIKEVSFEINFKEGGGIVNDMFSYASNIEKVPSIDFKHTTTHNNMANLFYYCFKLKEIGTLKNMYPNGMKNFFSSCYMLRELPKIENLNMSRMYEYNYCDLSSIFQNCYSLRSIPEELMKVLYTPKANAPYYVLFYGGFSSCSSLDEINGMVPTTETMTSNMFSSSFNECNRVKNITFALQEDDTPYQVRWKGQTIDLSQQVGYCVKSYSMPLSDWKETHIKECAARILNYNSGITIDKCIYNDETYALLKDDEDAFCIASNASGYADYSYSRYNHDSAVNTINSLPDTSAYLATAGGTNTIKFKGAAGSKTDGGAINTLTAEEIAVAAAKGWTVSLV